MTDERYDFYDEKPQEVYIIEYSYTNTGYTSEYMDGLYITIDDTVVDSQGYLGYSYPISITDYHSGRRLAQPAKRKQQ